MAANQVRYGCTALLGVNKKGIIKPDANGYYPITVGGFNVHNYGGAYYPLGEAAKLFEESGSLMRRIKAGVVRAELGHPRKENMGPNDFFKRLNEIYEEKVCGHFAEVWLDYDNYKSKSGFPMVAIVARVKPSGPYCDTLKMSLDNPEEETCFSIRAAVVPKMEGGREVRYVEDIVTWDYVNEGGIAIARKYYSMALESMDARMTDIATEDNLIVTPAMLEHATKASIRTMGLESEDTQRLKDLGERLGWDRPTRTSFPTPSYLKWS
jgi:hypothetical protein